MLSIICFIKDRVSPASVALNWTAQRVRPISPWPASRSTPAEQLSVVRHCGLAGAVLGAGLTVVAGLLCFGVLIVGGSAGV